MGLHWSNSVAAMLVVTIFLSIASTEAFGQSMGPANSTQSGVSQHEDYLYVVSNSEGHEQTLQIPASKMLFNVTPNYDSQGRQTSLSISLKPELGMFYQSVGLEGKPKDTVFIYPSFTQAAYGANGFYDYYRKQCDSSCLTVPIPGNVRGTQASSIVSALVLKMLGYPFLMDQDVDKNPGILKQYKKVIVLHNEYVTQREFDAITSQPDVIFLYPNALYAKVEANYDNDTITLVRGHGYPDASVKNGFGWSADNSRHEYDVQCIDWNFYHKGNYTMLDCYPEYKILTGRVMLELLQKPDPAAVSDDVANWLMYPQDENATESLLDDFDIKGTSVPSWVQSPALWLSNGEISKGEFGDLVQFLYQNKIIR